MLLSSAACVCNYWTAFPAIIKADYTLGGITALLGRQTIVIGLAPCPLPRCPREFGIPSCPRIGPCRIALTLRLGQPVGVCVVWVMPIAVGPIISRDCGCVSTRLASRDGCGACFLCVSTPARTVLPFTLLPLVPLRFPGASPSTALLLPQTLRRLVPPIPPGMTPPVLAVALPLPRLRFLPPPLRHQPRRMLRRKARNQIGLEPNGLSLIHI